MLPLRPAGSRAPSSCAPTAAEHRALVTTSPDGDRVTIELVDPAQGIAPGQAAVVYDGTRVVGSATITATARTRVTA